MARLLGHMCLRSRIVLSLFLILLPCVTDFAFLAVAQNPDVHILDLVYETREHPKTAFMAYKHGFNASLWSRNFTLSGRKVHMIQRSPSLDAVESEINQAVMKHSDLSLVLGPASMEVMLAALPALRKNNLVAFGPLTDSTTGRIWDPHLYFLLMDRMISVHTLLRHAVVNLRVRRLGFMYMTDVSTGDPEYNHIKEVMNGMDRELCGVFRLDGRVSHNADDVLFQKEWEVFAETRPQAVIIMGIPNSTTEPFVQQMMNDPRTNSAYLMVPAMLEGLTLRLWAEAKAMGAPSFPGQVITASSYPAPTDTSSVMINNYRSVMGKYLSESGQTLYKPAEGIPDEKNGGAAMLAGWVAGEVLSQAISQFNPSRNKEEFISSLFNQRSYIIGDVVVGTFGDNIGESFVRAGAMANCNQGSTTAYVRGFSDEGTSQAVHKGNYNLPRHVCRGEKLTLFDPAAIVTMHLTDFGSDGKYMVDGIIKGQKAGFSFGTSMNTHDMTLKVLQTTMIKATGDLQKEYESLWTNGVTGIVLDSMLDIPNLAFLDPMPSVAQLNKFRRNVIFLSPTMEQQLFVFAEYVASLPDRTVYAVIRSKSGRSTLDVLKKSLLTFDVELTSFVLLKLGDKINEAMGATGLTIMIGAEVSDIPIFVKHLEQNKNAHVVVLFAPFVFFYDKFCAAFNGTSAADRLLLVTNLPHWADAHSSSSVIRNYHKSIKDPSVWSPVTLQNFIVGRVIRDVLDSSAMLNSSSLTQYFYSSVAVSLDDMLFGPFADSNSITCTSKSKLDGLGCAKNFGATSISVWPMSRVFDPSVPPLFGPVNPSMVYHAFSRLTSEQLLGVIMGSVGGASVLIAVLVILIFCLCMHNINAPKDMEHPVTLIFTDIQSSTALWAACPEIMPEAVATHHRLIRQLIAKYKCYEVKTIGDSFMIACKSASAAVRLVIDLQRTFLHHDWGTSAVDQAYREFEERQAEEDADYEPPTARLDAAVYRKYWSGLRVRAGVHTGLSDIRHDEVTKRYDYYGSVSNTAARTESVAHGGQVLLTGAAYMALSAAERAGLDVTALGPVELRGVPQPVEMYQLNAVPGRAFAKLRLGREELVNCDSPYDQSTQESSLTDDSNGSDSVYFLLCVLFRRLNLQARLKILQPLCDRWSIVDPRRHAAYSDDKLCNVLISHLARRVGGVADKERCLWRETLNNTRRSLRSTPSLSRGTECLTDTSSVEVQCLNPWLLDDLWAEQKS